MIEYLLGRPTTQQEGQQLSDEKESIYRDLCLNNRDEFHLSPGAIELLDFLVVQNIPHTIATSSEKANVDFFIRHLKLDEWFHVPHIVYDTGTFPGKPAPDIYLMAATRLKLNPQHCAVVEDSHSGLMAAFHANVGKIIALGPKEKHKQLQSVQGVHEVITSLNQMKREMF